MPTPGPHPPPPPLPEHMKLDNWSDIPFPLNKILEIMLKTCCQLIYGHVDLEEAWRVCINDTDEQKWIVFEKRYSDRIGQLNIIGGLIFTGLATWITTAPPLANTLNYNERGSYICLLVAFGGTWGGIVVGSAIMYGSSMIESTVVLKTLMSTRSRVFWTLVMLAYPFFAMGVATAFGILGFLLATWRSPDKLVNTAGTLLFAFPMTMLFAFLWTQTTLLRRSGLARTGYFPGH
ncbi:hypothetical protein BDP27DRAFT_1236425 [Rhodocollybia butyracea]|uniref:Uncharacterized protein n=1 Tax=Rhodocollybia butyracea TaxID=206335 RepID=A0A9P5U0L6_9AGAR|nr:hypothetical protein BDP27DRAFT_1236425 [Rhodocollybia butyracea]